MDFDQFFATIGSRILELRKTLNMSQEALAEAAGIDRTHMGFIEQGRRRPTLVTLVKICAALNIKLTELLKGY